MLHHASCGPNLQPTATGRFESERRRRLAAYDGGRLVNEFVILKGRHHEQGKIHTARDVALGNGIAHVPAPHRQALALTRFEVAPAHDRPPRVTGKHPPARFHLVVDVHNAEHPSDPSGSLHNQLEGPRVHVPAIPRNVPATGKYEARGASV